MDRVFERAFNRAHGTVHNAIGSALARSDPKVEQKSKQDQLRALTTPMTATDVVERIDLAFKDGDYYRLLQLPGPHLNSLNKAEWAVSSSELSKAYRKLSILVHPDKAPGEAARQAFEQLKQAYNELRDPEKLAARLRDAEPTLHKAAERAAAAASMAERVEMNAAAEERRAKLRQEEARSFHEEIHQQMKRRQAEAAAKKQRAQSSRYKQQQGSGSSDEDGGDKRREKQSQIRQEGGRQQQQQRQGRQQRDGNSSSEEEDYTRRQLNKRPKKPRFIMAAPPPPFANDGSFLDKFKEMQKAEQPSAASTDASEAAAPPPPLPAADKQAEDPDYEPSTSFSGAREGFVFKTGEQGTGYYKDAPLHLQHKQKTKPVALKSNSIIKGLQRRTVAAPDAKRQKKDEDSSKPSYLKEMERYKSMACSADTKHDRPLVK